MVRKFSFKVKHCNLTTTNNATVAYENAVLLTLCTFALLFLPVCLSTEIALLLPPARHADFVSLSGEDAHLCPD